MRKITFDIETSNTFGEVESADPADLDLSVVCIHDSQTDQYSSFLQGDLPKLWPIIESADMLIGFNSEHFDIPLLNKYYSGDLNKIKSVDIMKEVRAVLGRRIKLDDLAQATLGKRKSADGLQAIVWWREGQIQKVIDYCIQDVKVTKEIYDYALTNGHLKYLRGTELTEIPLNTDHWEAKESGGLSPTLFG